MTLYADKRIAELSHQDLKTRIEELIAFLDYLSSVFTSYNEQYVRTLLEKITTYDNYFIVEFESKFMSNPDNTISEALFIKLWVFS